MPRIKTTGKQTEPEAAAQRESEQILRSTVDGLSAHIAVLDDQGKIILTNKSYRDFAERNGTESGAVSEGTNYLAVCDTASGEYSREAALFAAGIREVLSGKIPSFELEYPCHSPDEKRWFIGHVTPVVGEGPRRVVVVHENVTERKRNESNLERIAWMHDNESGAAPESRVPYYGDVTKLNTERVIRDSVGLEMLEAMGADLMRLLDTSVAVYEKNGDYAYGSFVSEWCSLMDGASRKLCLTDDNREALSGGRWLCHENCWNQSAKAAIESGKPTDIACVGGIHLYGMPIFAGDDVVGAINIGYGDPPTDDATLADLAETFGGDIEALRHAASAFKPRPSFIVETAKARLRLVAMQIGQMVENRRGQNEIHRAQALLQAAMDNSPAGIAIADAPSGKLRYVNDAGLRIRGGSREEIGNGVGVDQYVSSWQLLDHGGTPLPIDEVPLARAIKYGDACSREFIIRRAEGDDRTVLARAAAIKDKAGNVEAAIVVFLDITERMQLVEAQRESLQRLEFALQGGNLGMWDWNPQDGAVVYSDLLAQMLEYRPDEVEPTMDFFKQHVHPEDLGAVLERLTGHVGGRLPIYESEHRFRTKSGRWLWVLDRGKIAERDRDGRPVRVTGIIADITDHKQAETYREMGREILQLINESGDRRESIQRVLAVLKTRTGVDAVGLRLQEVEDFPYFVQDGFPDDFLATENTLVERGRDGGVCRDKDGNICLECTCGLVISGKTDPSNPLFSQGGSSWTNDSFPLLEVPSDQDPRLHARNNCIHHGYASVALIPIRTNDRIVGLIQLNDKRKGRFTLETIEMLEGIAGQIGSALMRKEAEEELRRRENLLQRIFETLPVGLWLADKNGALLRGNPAGVRIWGAEPHVSPSEYGVFKAWRLPSGEPVEAEDSALAKTIRDGITIVDELLKIEAFDGQKKTILNYTAPVLDEKGAVDGAIIVNLDISERMALESRLTQSQKMESVGRLAGGVAHDFNNMLNVILGHSELALDDLAADSPLRDDLEEIHKAAGRSANLTRQLLAFARRQTVAPKVLDLNETIASMLKMLERLIGEDIDLRWTPGTRLDLVHIDPGQVDQILANLAVNARDAIGHANGKVTIETANICFDDEYCATHVGFLPGAYVMLAVSDDGSGMDEETRSHIFEPFFTTKATGEGTGLGLATVYGIIKQNNGIVNVYSEPGKGTTFRIYLPAIGADSRRHEGARTSDGPAEGGNEIILIVEDEAAILNLTQTMLERLGYTVLTADTPAEALRMASEMQGKIDLLITDVVMPEMNGRDMASRLRECCPHIRSLFMSGYTANVIAHQGVLDDGVDFIQKPFSLRDLARKVREALES